jgi:hypothetical protein
VAVTLAEETDIDVSLEEAPLVQIGEACCPCGVARAPA